MHSTSETRTHDASVRAAEDSLCPRPRGHHHHHYYYYYYYYYNNNDRENHDRNNNM
jgi:hypothetical protein